MIETERARWDAVEGTALPWHCGACAALDDVSTAVSVARPPLTMGGGPLQWREKDKYLGTVQHESGGLDKELSARIKAGWAAFLRLRPLVLRPRPSVYMRGVYAQAFEAITVAVMLYGGEVWALSNKQLERMEVAQRGMLRSALPARLRRYRPGRQRMGSVQLLAYFGVKNVATLLARRQLRYLGHLARMPEDRLQRRLLRCWRVMGGKAHGGRGGAGCKGASLLGIFGQEGAYTNVIRTYLTSNIKRDIFDSSRESWFVLAQSRTRWRKFIGKVYAN